MTNLVNSDYKDERQSTYSRLRRPHWHSQLDKYVTRYMRP